MIDRRNLPVPRAIALPMAIPQKQPRWRRLAMQALGYFFLLVGVAGILLPFLHGLLFLFMGLAILSQEAEWAGRLRGWIARKFPRAHQVSVEAEFRAQRWMRRLVRRFRRR
ncbi:MAG: PGPGW domain-containing protein [Alphaproteobacteria bacterium]|nr:PGPGW domain-containing protein [Alphaproteobacteria bacterium]